MAKPGRPKKFKNLAEMQKAIDSYFKKAEKDHDPLTMAGLAYHLGIDRKTLINYSTEDEFFHAIKNARDRVQAWVEKQLFNPDQKPAGVIFNLKNNFGWRDEKQVDLKGNLTINLVRFADDNDSK